MELVKKVLNNDRASIAKAITLVESSNPKDKEESKQLISSLINHPGHSIRIVFLDLLVLVNQLLLNLLVHI